MTKIISAIDIGCGKICCIIAQAENNGDINIYGSSVKQSRGLKGGHIYDSDLAKEDIISTVQAAERMAGMNIGDNIIININGFHPKIETVEHSLTLDGREVREEDISALRNKIRYNTKPPEDYQLLHYFEQGFRLDKNINGQDFLQKNPLSMNCKELSLKSRLLFAPQNQIQQFKKLMQLCRLHVGMIIYTPYASCQSALLEQEKKLGTILIDMGAETTSFCVYEDGIPVLCDYVALGGDHITQKIASQFAIALEEAERLKALHGNLIESSADRNDILTVRHLGDNHGSHNIVKSDLTDIIRNEFTKILELLAMQLQKGGVNPQQVQNLVITGGGGNLPGVSEFLDDCFNRPSRLAKPQSRFVGRNNKDSAVKGLASSATGSEFACIIGMLRHATSHEALNGQGSVSQGRNLWMHLWHWVMKDPI